MFFKNRAWSITPAPLAPEELAKKLEQYTWTTCAGFRVVGPGGLYFWLNDSTGPDGAQECAVVRVEEETPEGARGVQVESYTVSWMKREELAESIRREVSGANQNYGEVRFRLHPPGKRCGGCA